MSSGAKNNRSFPTPTPDRDCVVVRSALKVWYYKTFKGYVVVRQAATPAPGLLGTVAYRKTWTLKPNREE